MAHSAIDQKTQELIDRLELLPHPEGGYFKETYRSDEGIDTNRGRRNYSTAIYFLLLEGNFSAFHRIASDELWHFYQGDPLEIHEISKNGKHLIHILGGNMDAGEGHQLCIPAGSWFGSRVAKGGHYALVGCTVAPGFEFEDFEMANRTALIREYPMHEVIVRELTR